MLCATDRVEMLGGVGCASKIESRCLHFHERLLDQAIEHYKRAVEKPPNFVLGLRLTDPGLLLEGSPWLLTKRDASSLIGQMPALAVATGGSRDDR